VLNLVRRISFNHATFGPDASFKTFIDVVAKSGAAGVGVWTERLDGMSPRAAGEAIRNLGLEISGVNRGGFFTGVLQAERQQAIDQTKRQIEATAELRADMLVIVPGGLSRDMRQIDTARGYVKEGVSKVAEFAREHGVRLAIEPFHPALSAARGVINTLDLALDLCEGFDTHVGVVTDIFHIWWDPNVYAAIDRAGSRIFGHHLCDWKLDTIDPFADRGVMGEGVADVDGLTAAIMRTDYQGWMEVEIFSRDHLWTLDAGAITALCLQRALSCLQKAEQLNGGKRLQNI
jgi:sugar phosphate isomerase/epimerase